MTDKRAILPNPEPSSRRDQGRDLAALFSTGHLPQAELSQNSIENSIAGAETIEGEPQYGSAIRLSSIDLVTPHPLDTFWRLAVAEGYDKERISADELHLSVSGGFSEYHISLSWDSLEERLRLFLIFDGRIYSGRSDQICRLITLINERLSAGHFDYWERDQSMVYRDGLSLPEAQRFSSAQAMMMIADAISAADKGYPACQYVLWADMSPEDAISTALLEQARRKTAD